MKCVPDAMVKQVRHWFEKGKARELLAEQRFQRFSLGGRSTVGYRPAQGLISSSRFCGSSGPGLLEHGQIQEFQLVGGGELVADIARQAAFDGQLAAKIDLAFARAF